MTPADRQRLLVYTDYTYARVDGAVYANRAFALFLSALAGRAGGLTIIGRLQPYAGEETARYPLGPDVSFKELPFYASLSEPLGAARALLGSLRVFWRALEGIDTVWLLGPHPLALLFIVAARLRGKRVFLGVRQDLPVYVASRHPGRRGLRFAATLLERAWRFASKRLPVVVVGPELARYYAAAPRCLEIAVSLVRESDLVDPADRSPSAPPLTILSVGRLDREKNPLLLVEVLRRCLSDGRNRWRMVVCGEGPMAAEIAERVEENELESSIDLRGYVGFGPELLRLYRDADVFLHVSWTEGFPQVLIEAAASATPIVATDVGGVRRAIGEGAVLVPPGDADEVVAALKRVADEPDLRDGVVTSASRWARGLTLEATLNRLADFLGLGAPPQSAGTAAESRPNAT